MAAASSTDSCPARGEKRGAWAPGPGRAGLPGRARRRYLAWAAPPGTLPSPPAWRLPNSGAQARCPGAARTGMRGAEEGGAPPAEKTTVPCPRRAAPRRARPAFRPAPAPRCMLGVVVHLGGAPAAPTHGGNRSPLRGAVSAGNCSLLCRGSPPAAPRAGRERLPRGCPGSGAGLTAYRQPPRGPAWATGPLGRDSPAALGPGARWGGRGLARSGGSAQSPAGPGRAPAAAPSHPPRRGFFGGAAAFNPRGPARPRCVPLPACPRPAGSALLLAAKLRLRGFFLCLLLFFFFFLIPSPCSLSRHRLTDGFGQGVRAPIFIFRQRLGIHDVNHATV